MRHQSERDIDRCIINPRPHKENIPIEENRILIQLVRAFSEEQMEKIMLGASAEQMEEKWNVFYYEDTLRFYRSWTGFCIFTTQFHHDTETKMYYPVNTYVTGAHYWGTTTLNDAGESISVPYTSEESAKILSGLIDVLLLRQMPQPSITTDEILQRWALMGINCIVPPQG